MEATTSPNRPGGAMSIIFTAHCPCGCGENVEAEWADFYATTVTVESCSTRQAAGIVSTNWRRSAVVEVQAAPAMRHHDGLVVFA